MADYKKADSWTQKARKEGYPARSVYKLKEIDEKFNIFRPIKPMGALRILDIGAAPGSWSLYVLRKLDLTTCTCPTTSEASGRKSNGQAFLASVDLSPLSTEFDKGLFSNKDNFFFVQGNITTTEVRETLLAKGPYTTIISDVAPNTSGNHTVDAARSFNLVEEVLNYAEAVLPDGRHALAPGGNLVVKVFQGGDSAELLKRIKTLFETAKTFKPTACRGESVETYFIGLGKK